MKQALYLHDIIWLTWEIPKDMQFYLWLHKNVYLFMKMLVLIVTCDIQCLWKVKNLMNGKDEWICKHKE